MTYLVNDPKSFAADSLGGFVAAFPDDVAAVHGGVVRATASPHGQVSVVVGGGSGHYPAFAGWVGPGMAHGAVCGNIFASPAGGQVASVVRAADNGGGTLLLFGNYAGDCLQFGKAAADLGREGLDARIVAISDDIASRDPAHHGERRGIAGDLFVVKVAGAAAEEGMGLDDVERLARYANDRARSLGVAFTGCTLPGADEPLFSVPEGQMAIGLGIHGETGIAQAPLGTAREVAGLLVDKVLAEEPQRGADYGGHVAVLLNGLGSTKYEELFVLFAAVTDLLTAHGLTAVHPVVGEQVTSLDMAGASLSVMFLDDDLERLWTAPADTPAYHIGAVAGRARREVRETVAAAAIPAGSPESAAQGVRALAALRAMAEEARAVEVDLGRLDAVAGDGDHGQGIVLGTSAALAAAEEAVSAGAGVATVFGLAGSAWSEGAGGTSGALWGEALTAFGRALSDAGAADENALAAAAIGAARRFEEVGGARPGDKTMVDATHPFAEALAAETAAGAALQVAWAHAVRAADEGARRTADLVARKGRARTHGMSSLGHPDPGAVSFVLLTRAVAAVLGVPVGAE